MQKSPLQNIDEIRTLYESGLTLQAVADLYGVSRQAVHDRLRRAGIERRKERPLMQLDRERLYQLRVVDRLSIDQICAELGVSSTVVKREFKRYGIKRIKASDLPSHQIDRAVLEKLYITDGLTQIKTAAQLGVRVEIVQRELRRHAITFRHRRRPGQPRFTYDLLYGLYHTEVLNCDQIAERLGIGSSTVRDYLRRLGIKTRRNGRPTKPIITDRETLQRLYIVEGKTRPQIAEMFAATLAQVEKALRQYGIRKKAPGNPTGTVAPSDN